MEWQPWEVNLLRMIHGQTRGAVRCRWYLDGGREGGRVGRGQSIRAVLGRVHVRGGRQEPWKGDGLGEGEPGRAGKGKRVVGK